VSAARKGAKKRSAKKGAKKAAGRSSRRSRNPGGVLGTLRKYAEEAAAPATVGKARSIKRRVEGSAE
jgi:hypothetical protein